MADDLTRYLHEQLADPEFARAYVAEQKELERAKDAEIARLRFHLNEANQIMRSAFQIALREKDRDDRTNWRAFAARLHSELITQHEVIYGVLDGDALLLSAFDGDKEGSDQGKCHRCGAPYLISAAAEMGSRYWCPSCVTLFAHGGSEER